MEKQRRMGDDGFGGLAHAEVISHEESLGAV